MPFAIQALISTRCTMNPNVLHKMVSTPACHILHVHNIFSSTSLLDHNGEFMQWAIRFWSRCKHKRLNLPLLRNFESEVTGQMRWQQMMPWQNSSQSHQVHVGEPQFPHHHPPPPQYPTHCIFYWEEVQGWGVYPYQSLIFVPVLDSACWWMPQQWGSLHVWNS